MDGEDDDSDKDSDSDEDMPDHGGWGSSIEDDDEFIV